MKPVPARKHIWGVPAAQSQLQHLLGLLAGGRFEALVGGGPSHVAPDKWSGKVFQETAQLRA